MTHGVSRRVHGRVCACVCDSWCDCENFDSRTVLRTEILFESMSSIMQFIRCNYPTTLTAINHLHCSKDVRIVANRSNGAPAHDDECRCFLCFLCDDFFSLRCL